MNQNHAGTIGGNTIAIIGGGFSGSMLAVELLRRNQGYLSVVLIERRSAPGRGVAYSTQFEGHLLNVRAKNMSAYADAPDHFVKWAQRHYNASAMPDDFLPRPVFGNYISSQLQAASSVCAGKFRCIREEAVSMERAGGSSLIRLANGKSVVADKVVLALGNFPPADLQIPGKTAACTRFISNPWMPNALNHATHDQAAHDQSVLLIGSGLTSVDVILELRAKGFAGTIHVLSRRGFLPQRHAAVPLPQLASEEFPRTVRGLLRLIRLQVKSAEERGSNWRAVIDSLRPVTQQIWRSLPLEEQRRFLRHLRAYWDVHRHRIAERIGGQLDAQIQSGQLQIHAGRIAEYCESANSVEISYRDRKTLALAKLRVDRVINCTGPDGDLRHVSSPLLLELMNRKLVRPDQVSLGLDVADDGAVVDSEGSASNFLYALGPLRKGKLWESIAVPELRMQVAHLANLLASDLRTGTSISAGTELLASIHS
jgi:uncharacterized NAD(P)/FAD-binding protein YdhS